MKAIRRRVLSIDGAGIYGLTSARWLRRLCEQEPSFLNGEDVYLFAGCSSGAVNSLLLAQRDKPRDAVLSGELEEFWHDPGTFTNSNPMGQMLSWMELSGWFGEKDFMDLLVRHFGDRTLGDLKHRVLISTFNWAGAPPDFPPIAKGGEGEKAAPAVTAPSFATLLQDLAKGFSPQQGANVPSAARIADDRRRWHPEMFSNAKDSAQRRFRVADIAYGAATPPGFRALRGGIGDGASFSASPSVDAIAHLVAEERERQEDRAAKRAVVHDVLDTISLLSLGDGTYSPYHFLPNNNLGFSTWDKIPANPLLGAFWGPSSYSLQPAEMAATHIAQELLGDEFFRLNAPIMDIPTVVAAYIARWPSYRLWLLHRIEQATKTELSEAGVADALRFVRSDAWLEERGSKTR